MTRMLSYSRQAKDYQRLAISGQAIVVAFDMCSSSNIIEDLTSHDNVEPLTTFFSGLKRYLAKEQKEPCHSTHTSLPAMDGFVVSGKY